LLPFLALLVSGGEPALPVLADVPLGDQLFQLEVAHTPRSRQKGLMDREDLPFDRGMIFVFPAAEDLVFWMYQTRFDLDILFLDATGVVVDIQTMPAEIPRKPGETEADYGNRLPRYKSHRPAQFAIELSAGMAAAVGVKENDRIPLDIPALQRLVANEREESRTNPD
jgi:uncharacterized membrane protein (UPF0127 family)